MIRTQHGGMIRKITRFQSDTGIVTYLRGDNQTRQAHILSLRADGGIAEILEAAKLVEEHIESCDGDNAPACPECSATGEHYLCCSHSEK